MFLSKTVVYVVYVPNSDEAFRLMKGEVLLYEISNILVHLYTVLRLKCLFPPFFFFLNSLLAIRVTLDSIS
jgi:hypothetical protein